MSNQRDHQLDEVLEEFIAAYRAGEPIDVEGYRARHPEISDDIRELFPALIRLEQARPVDSGGTFVPWSSSVSGLSGGGVPPLGDYRIVREIGRGGMGVVYEAVQESLNRPVALKVLSDRTLCNPRHVQRFEREARAAAQLHHTNIVPILGVGEDRGVHYLVMQLIRGVALDEIIAALRAQPVGEMNGQESPPTASGPSNGSPGNLPTAQMIAEGVLSGRYVSEPATGRRVAVRHQAPSMRAYWRGVAAIGLQAAEALAHAASQGVVHRDIKPSNLLIDVHGTVWIADFGLAKTTDSADLTMSGELMGTIRYLPPERLSGQSDNRGDIYGLGATLYELITFQAPFNEADHAALLKQVVDVEPRRPRSLRAAIPRDLETIVVKAMAKAPADRYQLADDLAADLRLFLQDSPISARRTSAAERLWRACRRHPAVAIPTAATLLLLVAVALISSIAAAWLQRENQIARAAEHRAVQAEHDRRQELFRAHLATARSSPVSGRAGQRLVGLQAVRDALQVGGSESLQPVQMFDLVDAAIPCLASTDVQEVYRSPSLTGWIEETDVDAQLAYYTQPLPRGSGTAVVSMDEVATRREYRDEAAEDSTFRGMRRFSPRRQWIGEITFRSTEDGSKRTRVWEFETGRLAIDLTSECAAFWLEFLPDERHLLIIGDDNRFRIVDLITGKVVQESPPRFNYSRCTCSPNGQRLAIVNSARLAEIVDVGTWQTIDVLLDAPLATSVAFNNDDSLVVGTENGRLFQWRLSERHGDFLPGNHKSRIDRLAFTPDGELLASCGDDVTQIRRMDGDGALVELAGYALKFSSDGKKLVVRDGNHLAVYQLVMQEVLRTVKHASAESAAFDPDGHWLAMSGARGVALLGTNDWMQRGTFGLDLCGPVAFAPSGSALVTCGLFSEACHWPMQTDGSLLRIGPPRSLWHERLPDFTHGKLAPQHQGRQALFTPDGVLFTADYRRGRVMMQDSVDQPAREFAHLLNVARLSLTPDGQWLAGAAVFSTLVRVWDVRDARAVLEVPFHSAVAFSPDAQWLATRSDSELHLYRVGTWELIHRISLGASRSSWFLPMAFRPHSSLLAVAGPLQRVYLYDAGSGRLITRLPHADEGIISHLTFSPDGSQLIVVRRETAFSVWNLDCLGRELEDLNLRLVGDLAVPSARAVSTNPPENIVVESGPFSQALWSQCWLRLALKEASEKRWPDALNASHAAIGLAGDVTAGRRAELITLRGTYHLLNHEPYAARDNWISAMTLDPDTIDAPYFLARLYILGPTGIRDIQRALPLLAILKERGDHENDVEVLKTLVNVRDNSCTQKMVVKVERMLKDSKWREIGAYFLALAQHELHDNRRAADALLRAHEYHEQRAATLTDMEYRELEDLRIEVDALLEAVF